MGHGARVGRVGVASGRGASRGWCSEGELGRWDVQMGGSRWPNGSALPGKAAGAARDRSVVELVGKRLVEYEVWDGLDLGGIEGQSLVEQEVSLRRTSSG